ncbi:cysteine rich repeat family protein, partial [Aphelenchoides avenae]
MRGLLLSVVLTYALAQQNVGNPPPVPGQNQNVPPPVAPQQQQAAPANAAQTPAPAGQQGAPASLLAQRAECRADIENYCKKTIAQLPPGETLSDMAALECLQDAGYSEKEHLQPACVQLVWEYKISLTQDNRFINAITQFCGSEISKVPHIAECIKEQRSGYALSCMLESIHEIDQTSKCFQFLARTERLAFSDFRLVAPFVEHCGAAVSALECGTLTKPSAHTGARMPHSQGSVLECLIDKLVNVPKDPQKAAVVQGISKECRHQVMRIAELQSDDFHLDRPLYFACREDRE